MIRVLLTTVLLLVFAGIGRANTVTVRSGEHEGFSRLVLEFPKPVDWQFGRTEDGYELRLPDAGSTYDLSQVYRLIDKTRVAAVWTSPDQGSLFIGLGCACHAIPFEYRPGVVVIDIKDGPPPHGSSFELALDAATAPASVDTMAQDSGSDADVGAPAYNWISLYRANSKESVQMSAPGFGLLAEPLSVPQVNLGLQTLRDSVLHQMSRSASAGIIDMEMPQVDKTGADDALNGAQIRIGESDNMSTRLGDAPQEVMSKEGMKCFTDEQLAIAEWGDDRPIAQQMAEAMAGLVGEFDRVDTDALAKAVHFELHLGFGAEARVLLEALPSNGPDVAIWKSMAHILDDEPDPDPAFLGMASCDTNAALWAILGDPAPKKGDLVQSGAAIRAASALPIHLRRYLGPRLAGRFLELDDPSDAIAVQSAILRASGDAGANVELMAAKIDEKSGAYADADARMKSLLTESGPENPEVLVSSVESRTARGLPISKDMVTALEAMAREREGTAQAARYDSALLLARAASGDFESAFAQLSARPEAEADLWRLLAKLGDDNAVLAHATLLPDTAAPKSAAPVSMRLAERMLELGLAAQAHKWASLTSEPEPMLLATIAMGQHDAAEVLRVLSDVQTQEALLLKATASTMIGDHSAAAAIYAELGQVDAQWNAVNRSRDWKTLASDAPDPWKGAAAVVEGVQSADANAADAAASLAQPGQSSDGTSIPGPLAKGRMLVDQSVSARESINRLLATVPAL